MNDRPLNAMEVVRHLGDLSQELDKLVESLGEEDMIATVKKEEYVRAYAKAWKASVGPIESRKQMALSLTEDERLAAEVADCQVRDLRRRVDALKVRIDVGRSYGAAVRAETELFKGPFGQ